MKTLYVSDLDGTLLRSDETISEFTCKIINGLVEKGVLFSYATARSVYTAKKVTAGLDAKIPLIVYNGTFIYDNKSGQLLVSNVFDERINDVISDLIKNNVYPITYAYINEEEKYSFCEEKCSVAMQKFLNSRRGDERENPVDNEKKLYEGELFHITCIDEEEKLRPLYEKYKDEYYCTFYRDMYTQEQWLEIMPTNVSKANAIEQLKEYLKCDKVVVFGDQMNDIDMFKIADECYAVKNAIDELKELATGVIESNDDDGVAKWLKTHI